jgi:ribosomal protein S18 acetylase RimI-like enzyme
VNRTNPAVNFYQKIGFEIVESIDLDLGNGYFMNDYRMKIKI